MCLERTPGSRVTHELQGNVDFWCHYSDSIFPKVSRNDRAIVGVKERG